MDTLGNFQGIGLETDICIITLDDNLTHTYCSKIKWEKDNYTPIGVAQLIMPFDTQISEYWAKYSGTVIIHANLASQIKTSLMNAVDTLSLNLRNMQKAESKLDKQNNKIRLQNDVYNYSFIGKVNRFKQVGKTFIVYIEDIGWKFMQKVPKDFRASYIAGQKLGDAFQSICEFIGVEFAYSIEDLNKFSFAADGYSVEKDGQIIEEVSTILSEWKTQTEKSTDKNSDKQLADNLQHKTYENAGLVNYDKKNQDSSNNQSANQTTQSNAQSFDDLTIQLQMNFDEKIKDLFKGNTFYNSNVSDPVMNYDWITQKTNQTTEQTTEQQSNQRSEETQNGES